MPQLRRVQKPWHELEPVLPWPIPGDMRCVLILVVGLALGLCLTGCGAEPDPLAANSGGSGAGCTEWWTGATGDANYSNPGNWSHNRVPNSSDVACIRPGALVEITTTPPQMPATLINEGTLCLEAAVTTFGTLDQGAPPGQAPFPPMPGVVATPQCPSSQGHPPGGSSPQPGPAPATPTPPPTQRSRSADASLVD